jgi:Arc/MetJ-type ribon-helix-helix transcriptional regulator
MEAIRAMRFVKGISMDVDNVLRIEKLVQRGTYRSFSHFMDTAAREKLEAMKSQK